MLSPNTETENADAFLSDPATPRVKAVFDGEVFKKAYAKLGPTLKRLGIPRLRPGQDRSVLNLLGRKDTIAILPTGHGKSMIYIVPTLCHNWKCLIFSPLISLMQDQMESLLRLNLSAAQMSSGQTQGENDLAMRMWQAGELQFLLVAPERMQTKGFMDMMRSRPPNLIAVDEAHVISQWGHNFRVEYSKIGGFIKAVNPDSVLALTATATEEVMSDIVRILGVAEASKIVYYPPRRNLILSGKQYRDVFTVKHLLDTHPGSTIVYCNKQGNCEELYNTFGDDIEGGSLVYHGGMTPDERTTNQESFMSGRIRVMFATNAFGMGINKKDIRNVIHRDAPASVESYSQESGRAGRDDLESQCILLFSEKSMETNKWLIDQEFPGEDVIRRVFYYIHKVADPKTRVLKLTTEQIGQCIGETSFKVAAALASMDAAGVVKRGKESEEEKSKVKLIREDHVDKTYANIMAEVKQIGFDTPQGLEFNLSTLIKRTGIKDKKLKDALKDLDKAGYIVYTKPFAGKTTRILSDLSIMDFDALHRRHLDKLTKLASMREYYKTPDSEKHEFLQNYFVPSDAKV